MWLIRLIRHVLGLVVIAFGLLMALIIPFPYKAGDTAGAVVLAVLDVACLLLGLRLLLGRRRPWRDDPATDKQKAFADELGIGYPKGITKGELSDRISEVTGR